MDRNYLYTEGKYDSFTEDELFDPYMLIEQAIRDHYNFKHEFIDLIINEINNLGSDIFIKGSYMIKDNRYNNSRDWQGEFDLLLNEYLKIKKISII